MLFGYPDSKVHGAHIGPTWGRQVPGGPHVSHMNLAIRVDFFLDARYIQKLIMRKS